MKQTLQNILEQVEQDIPQTRNLQLNKENFSDESICDKMLSHSTFKNISLLNCNFIKINFESSFFKGYLFENCTFASTIFQGAEFENCTFRNCRFINCNLSKVDFTETNFVSCQFDPGEKGSLIKAYFESCHFIETNFDGFVGISLWQAILVDLKVSKANRSIDLKGNFSLDDILRLLPSQK